MNINRELAEYRRLDENMINQIEYIHSIIEKLIARSSLGVFNQSVFNEIEYLEYDLQRLWGFPKDCDYHTHKFRYEFKCQWVGTQWKCNTTGEIFTVPEDVEECCLYSWGDALLDVGRLNGYCRLGNCAKLERVEVKI